VVAPPAGGSVQKAAKWATKINTLNENISELLRYTTFTVFNNKKEIKKNCDFCKFVICG
jgi:hypothetical protein